MRASPIFADLRAAAANAAFLILLALHATITGGHAAVIRGTNASSFVIQYNFTESGALVGASFSVGSNVLTDGSKNPIGPGYSVLSTGEEQFTSAYTSSPITGGGAYFELWYTDADIPAPNPRKLAETGVDPNAFGAVRVMTSPGTFPWADLDRADRMVDQLNYYRGYTFFQSEVTQTSGAGSNQPKPATQNYDLVVHFSADRVLTADTNGTWITSIPPGGPWGWPMTSGASGYTPPLYDPSPLVRVVDSMPGTNLYNMNGVVDRPYNKPAGSSLPTGFTPAGSTTNMAGDIASAIGIMPLMPFDPLFPMYNYGAPRTGAIRWFIRRSDGFVLSNLADINVYRRGTARISNIPSGGFTGSISTWPQIGIECFDLYPAYRLLFLLVPRPSLPGDPPNTSPPKILKAMKSVNTAGFPASGPIPPASLFQADYIVPATIPGHGLSSPDTGLPNDQSVIPMTLTFANGQGFKIDATTSFTSSGRYAIEVWAAMPINWNNNGGGGSWVWNANGGRPANNIAATAFGNNAPEAASFDLFQSRSSVSLSSTVDANGNPYNNWNIIGPSMISWTWMRIADTGASDFLVVLDAAVKADIIVK
jgi:hypothetical protein